MVLGFYSRKLIERCRSELGIDLPDDVYIYRTRAGWNNLSAGAFRWTFESKTNPLMCNNIGSQHTVKECARAARLVIDNSREDVCIDAYYE